MSRRYVFSAVAVVILLLWSKLFDRSSVLDKRVNYVRHALPAETQIFTVVQGPTTTFGQQIIQLPNPSSVLELASVNAFWSLKEAINDNEVLLCIRAVSQHKFANGQNLSSSAHFLFLPDNSLSEIRVRKILEHSPFFKSEFVNATIYRTPANQFFCQPKPGLLVGTDDEQLLQTILHRLDAWWLADLAMPDTLTEWNYVDQSSQFWGVRSLRSSITTGAAGLTYQFKGDSTGFLLVCIASQATRKDFSLDVVDRALNRQCVKLQDINDHATQIQVRDSLCFGMASYGIRKLFDPATEIHIQSR